MPRGESLWPRAVQIARMIDDAGGYTQQRRAVGAGFGVFFIIVAILLAFAADASNAFGVIVCVIAVGGLGVDAVISAWRQRRSLLERIGPLP